MNYDTWKTTPPPLDSPFDYTEIRCSECGRYFYIHADDEDPRCLRCLLDRKKEDTNEVRQ